MSQKAFSVHLYPKRWDLNSRRLARFLGWLLGKLSSRKVQVASNRAPFEYRNY